MEKLIINVPEQKSVLVKQLLKELGVTIQQESLESNETYIQKLAKVSTWSDDDLKTIEQAKSAFESLKPKQW